jgi:DNA polymerase III subunit epsilon
MKPKLPEALAFVDTETTGLNPRRNRIIELGIIRVENGREVARMDTMLNPHLRLPPEIYKLTGITNDDLLRAPDWSDVQNDVREILEGAVFVAHNARFDYAFLKHEFMRGDSELKARVMCTVKLTRKLFPGLPRYSLSSIIDHFGLSPKSRHRAFADAEVLHDLFKLAISTHGEANVAKAVHSILKSPSLPSNLPKTIVDDLPESSGVYTFFGDSNLPLYVGKSVNIKARVKSHFAVRPRKFQRSYNVVSD